MSETKAKWTPGKWSAFQKPLFANVGWGDLCVTGHDPDVWIIKSEIHHGDDETIAKTTIHFGEIRRCGNMSDEELEATARACAAAPAMAEALYNALVLLKALTGPDDKIAMATIDQGEAALSLARGETK
jgi:hypothetical protein